MSEPLPALRFVDQVLIEHEGQPRFCLLDPAGYVDEQIVLSPHAFVVASCLNGENDVEAVQAFFAKVTGGIEVQGEQVLSVVEHLDQSGFLLTPRFEALRASVEESFRKNPVRPAALAGAGYPSDPVMLRDYIDQFFGSEGAPERLPEPGSEAAAPLRALIVPHIDFERGAAAYAQGYARLYAAGRPRTVFVFGVSHGGAPVPFVLTRKDFETPFGTVRVDQEAVSALEAACAWNATEYEIAHRREHSIELQAVMLAYLYGEDVKIVPVLCAMLDEDPRLSNPSVLPEVMRFLAACRDYAAPPERRVTALAGADLAHVGRRFGDDYDIDMDVRDFVSDRDHEDLASAQDVAPEAWYKSVMKDGNERRVCGLNCIYAMLKMVEGNAGPGRLLHYGDAPDPNGGIVSFASIEFPEA